MPNSYRRSDLNATEKIGTVYLLHFSRPYKGARHYVGYTERDVEKRVQEHNSGHGSGLTNAAHAAGIQMELERTWIDVDAVVEYIIKSRAESPKLCPRCNPDAYRFAQYPEFSEPIAIEILQRIDCEAQV